MLNNLANIFSRAREIREEDRCEGLFYRCKKNVYVNDRGDFVEQTRMSLLKRKSCKGCDQCGYLVDSFRESIWCNEDHPVIMDEPLEKDAIYKLLIVNESTDYETGYVDDWDYEFRKVKETKDE